MTGGPPPAPKKLLVLSMNRDTRNLFLQRCIWNSLGFRLLRCWNALDRRVRMTLFNRSLQCATNGEMWLPTLLPASPTVCDVGFYEGEYTEAIRRLRPNARIICFDPSRSAKRCFDLKDYGAGASFVHAALDKVNGQAQFHDYHNMCGSLSARTDAGELQELYSVPVYRLDTWASEHGVEHVDLLKIDAEGYDANILEGATQLLSRQSIDIFQFEYADGWIANRRFLVDVVRLLEDKPYGLFRLFNGFLVEFEYSTLEERFDLGTMMVGVSVNRLARGDIKVRAARI